MPNVIWFFFLQKEFRRSFDPFFSNQLGGSGANGSMGHPQPILFPPSLFGQGLASVRLPCSLRNNAAAGLLRAPWNAVWCKRIPLKPERGFWSFIQTWACCLGQHSCHQLWYVPKMKMKIWIQWLLYPKSKSSLNENMDYVRHGEIQGRSLVFF